MRRIMIIAVAVMTFGVCGCEDNTDIKGRLDAIAAIMAENAAKVKPAVSKTTEVIEVVTESVEKAKPVIVELEKATGEPAVSPKIAKEGARAASHAETGLKAGAGIAAVLGQPGIAALLGGLGTLAGVFGTFFQRRKTQQVAKAAVAAANKSPGGGKAISDEASRRGVGDLVNAIYREGG